MPNAFDVQRLESAPFGVEIRLDPSRPLDDADQAELRRVYEDHHLILIREQEMTYEEQVRFAGYLGPVLHQAGKQYVSNTRPDGLLGSNELLWHSDIQFTENPYYGICLHAVEIDPGRTSTRYANMVRACKTLPSGLRAKLEGRTVLLKYRLDWDVEGPRLDRPVIDGHPLTDQEMLTPDQLHTAEFSGLTQEESDELRDELFAHQYGPENVYEHWWQLNDLVLWDNRAVQHARGRLDPESVGVRTLRRVTLATQTIEEQVENFRDLRDAYYPGTYHPSGSYSDAASS